MPLKPGEKSLKNLIYSCSGCGDFQAIIKGEKAAPCNICKNNTKQVWRETDKELFIMTKNIKKMIEDKKKLADKVSDKITDWCGSVNFLYIHIVWFGGWLIYNTTSNNKFDPYPFGLLTLIVSLEAIILATFILISQNRQGEVTDLRSEADYQIDLKVEKRIAEILAILKKMRSDIEKK